MNPQVAIINALIAKTTTPTTARESPRGSKYSNGGVSSLKPFKVRAPNLGSRALIFGYEDPEGVISHTNDDHGADFENPSTRPAKTLQTPETHVQQPLSKPYTPLNPKP